MQIKGISLFNSDSKAGTSCVMHGAYYGDITKGGVCMVYIWWSKQIFVGEGWTYFNKVKGGKCHDEICYRLYWERFILSDENVTGNTIYGGWKYISVFWCAGRGMVQDEKCISYGFVF